MNISVSTWSYRYHFRNDNMGILEFMEEVNNLGAEGIEIHPEFIDQDDLLYHLKKVIKKAEKLNLNISSFIAANDFAFASSAKRAEEVRKMIEKIEIIAKVGIEKMNVFTGYHQDGQDPVMESMRVKDCFREVIPAAEENDIILCLENHSSVHEDADGLLSVIKYIGSGHLKTNPDPTNFCKNHTQVDKKSREVIYKETKKIAPYMGNAHLKINTFNDNDAPEYVDVTKIIDIFKKVDYNGDIVLEYFGEGSPRESIKNGINYLEYLL